MRVAFCRDPWQHRKRKSHWSEEVSSSRERPVWGFWNPPISFDILHVVGVMAWVVKVMASSILTIPAAVSQLNHLSKLTLCGECLLVLWIDVIETIIEHWHVCIWHYHNSYSPKIVALYRSEVYGGWERTCKKNCFSFPRLFTSGSKKSGKRK